MRQSIHLLGQGLAGLSDRAPAVLNTTDGEVDDGALLPTKSEVAFQAVLDRVAHKGQPALDPTQVRSPLLQLLCSLALCRVLCNRLCALG